VAVAIGVTSRDEDFVRFHQVDKTYDGEILVIRDLSFSMRRGEFLTLLGPSGSGKTTTLMMLAGFEQPTGGIIEMEGQALSRQPPHRRNFGMVFQDYSLFPHMTVAENVGFPLAIRRLPRSETRARVRQALEMVQLAGLDDRRPGQLSGGQQQRVALARALVFQPRLILMDEPLGALDRQLREQMQLEIKHLQKRLGITAVYVTHDQQEALTMSDRIAVFHEGRIRQLGTPDELYERPANAFVAQFVGENNRLEGAMSHLVGSRCRVRLSDGTEVVAETAETIPTGSRVVLSVRPEVSGAGGRGHLLRGPRASPASLCRSLHRHREGVHGGRAEAAGAWRLGGHRLDARALSGVPGRLTPDGKRGG
jgi:putative spermidine/putrescine transport system ATP-binding protein